MSIEAQVRNPRTDHLPRRRAYYAAADRMGWPSFEALVGSTVLCVIYPSDKDVYYYFATKVIVASLHPWYMELDVECSQDIRRKIQKQLCGHEDTTTSRRAIIQLSFEKDKEGVLFGFRDSNGAVTSHNLLSASVEFPHSQI